MLNLKCVVCGEIIFIGEICRDCEEKILKEVREKAHILSTVTTIILLLALFITWWVFGPAVMEIDTTTIKDYPLILEISFEIMRSPELFPLIVAGLILIAFAILYEMYFKELFSSGSKKYHI